MKIWKLDLMDGGSLDVPEASAELVQAALKRGDKFIFFPGHSIPSHQVKNFERTGREDTTGKKLLHEGINAFKGQVKEYEDSNGYNMIAAIKVKKQVGQREFTTYYAKHPSYECISEGNWVSFWIAKDLGIPEGCVLA